MCIIFDFLALTQSLTFSTSRARFNVAGLYHACIWLDQDFVHDEVEGHYEQEGREDSSLPDTSLDGKKIGVARVHLDAAVGVVVQ